MPNISTYLNSFVKITSFAECFFSAIDVLLYFPFMEIIIHISSDQIITEYMY